jgi:DNA-binding transcriptional LysR family regulator
MSPEKGMSMLVRGLPYCQRRRKGGQAQAIALTVPNFMLAIAIVAETDPVTVLPRSFAAAPQAIKIELSGSIE